MTKTIVATVVLAIITNCSFGQTYTSSSYAVAGDTLYITRDSIKSANNYNYDSTGTNIIWDFSKLTGYSQRILIFRQPSQTGFTLLTWPYIYTANNTNLSSTFQGQTVAIGSNFYASDFNDYYKKTTSYLEQKASSYYMYIRSVRVPVRAVWSQPDSIYRFPITYGNTDSCTAGYTASIPGLYYQNKKINRRNKVDGTGTVITPYGTFTNCLRITTNIVEADSTSITDSASFASTSTYRDINWFSTNQNYPLLTVRQQWVNGKYVPQYIEYYDVKKFFPPDVKFAYFPILPQVADTVVFQNLSNNATGYRWDFGDPTSIANTSTNDNPSHSYTKQGTYTVKLICYNGPLSDSLTLPVKVKGNTFTWTGAVDTDWYNAANWDKNEVPNDCGAIVIIPATTLQPIISTSVTIGSLQLNTGAVVKALANIIICN